MGKLLAIVFLIVFVWFAVPHLRRGEWLAPTAISPDWQGLTPTYGLASPPEGYGWFRFDFWNNPPYAGRPVSRDDFRL
jgi:hypothetical protein